MPRPRSSGSEQPVANRKVPASQEVAVSQDAVSANPGAGSLDLDTLERFDPTPDQIRAFDLTGWTILTKKDKAALIQRLREVADRLSVLDHPGTPTAILNGMFDYAESKGHPKYSSSHALGFLIDLIESQEQRLREAEAALADTEDKRVRAVDALVHRARAIPKDDDRFDEELFP